MPVYEYECANGHRVEVIQRIDAPGPVRCETCGAPLHKLLARPAIVFKGSGWAKKDARTASGRAASSGPSAVHDGERGHDEPGSKTAGDGAVDRGSEPGAAPARSGPPGEVAAEGPQRHDPGGATSEQGARETSGREASKPSGTRRGSDEPGPRSARADRARGDDPGRRA